jgi:hypothetical protein
VQLRIRTEREAFADLSVVRDVHATLKRLSPIHIGSEPAPINA